MRLRWFIGLAATIFVDSASVAVPQIEQTIADVNVRSHTLAFISPDMTDQFTMPSACPSCHTDRTTEWARDALTRWPGVSPWLVRQ